jgi:transcriptional repressor NrdR
LDYIYSLPKILNTTTYCVFLKGGGILKCPYCDSTASKVVDKRDDVEFNRRRRECIKCKARFTTYEKIELKPLMIKKKNNELEPFDSEKIRKGMMRACEKRPISEDSINQIAIKISQQIRLLPKRQQNSKVIGKLVMQALKDTDPVAYLRFASVYQNFRNIKAFESEVKKLKK